jgi:DNA-binding transcriptional LysR family regulator
MLDLNEVRMFVQVVRAGSFAAAARRLGVPPNTLSRRVRQLEGRVETRLLQRSTRKLTLTAPGREFYERAAPALDGILEAGQDLSAGSRRPSGQVRVAAPASFLDLLRVEWVAQFLRKYPQIRLDFVLDDARVDLIGAGIDVAFRAGKVTEAHYLVHPVMSQDFALFASAAYLKERGHPADLAAVAAHDCLTHSGRPGQVPWELEGPNGAEEVKVAGRFSANNMQVLLHAAVSGLGIALLPMVIAAPEVRAGRLTRVLPEYRRDGADLNIVVPSRQQIPAAVVAFTEFAEAKLRLAIQGP